MNPISKTNPGVLTAPDAPQQSSANHRPHAEKSKSSVNEPLLPTKRPRSQLSEEMEAKLKKQRRLNNIEGDPFQLSSSDNYRHLAPYFNRGDKALANLASTNHAIADRWNSRAKSDRLIHAMNNVLPEQIGHDFFQKMIDQANDLSPEDRHAVLMLIPKTVIAHLQHSDDNMESVLLALLGKH